MPDIFKSDYKNLNEAFEALPQDIREHSVRVSEYMKTIFLEASANDIYAEDENAKKFMKEDLWELAAAAGKFHDIGKLFVPEVYRKMNRAFSDEEIALYYRHSTDSARLVGGFYRDDKKMKVAEINLVEDTILHHHEAWDASGYPSHMAEEEIPVWARILKVADALDNLSANVHSEKPLAHAIDVITDASGTEYAPEIVAMLPAMAFKLKRVFDAHIAQTRAVPVTEPVIRRMASRPMALRYRPITDRKTDTIKAYEAKNMFRVKTEWKEYEDVAEAIRKGKMEGDIAHYMVVEACDALNRMDACNIQTQYIAMELPGASLNKKGLANTILDAVNEMGVKPEKICIMAGDKAFMNRTATMEENLKKLHEGGVSTMVCGNMTNLLSFDEIRDLQFTHAKANSDMFEGSSDTDSVSKLGLLAGQGVRVVADSLERPKYQKGLNRAAVLYAVGPASGDYMEEDELIERELALQN